jgi:hypothetical protein
MHGFYQKVIEAIPIEKGLENERKNQGLST